MIGYKLMRQRKDGSLGSLFINAKEKYHLNKWMWAKPHKRKGFAFRPGWHVMKQPNAPHLSTKDRVWCKVECQHVTEFNRPKSQGGKWMLAKRMRIIEIINPIQP